MPDNNAVQNGKPDQSNAAATVADSVPPQWAGWFGVALTFLALIGFFAVAGTLPNNSLGFGALAGVAIISVSLTALIILSRAMGIADPSAALGLPSGSIRALLAIGLAVVFVAVASWTLGGLFDPTGRQVAQLTLASGEVGALQQRYPATDYMIVETQRPATGNAGSLSDVKVYLKRGVDQNLIDLAKQILTISATVLVTIIGFYFGSNSAADAARSVSDALKNAGAGANGASTTPTVTDPQQAANTIISIAAGIKAKLQAYGDDPMALLRRAIAGSTDSELTSALGVAQDQLTVLNAKANAIATDADRAKEAMAAAPSSDPAVVNSLKDRLGRLLADATAANHDFEQALAKFQEARTTILRKTAKG
jgi:hypothetical protein